MRKILFIACLLLLSSSIVYGDDDEICSKYQTCNDPASALQRLMYDSAPEAQLCVGGMYYLGIGAKKDVHEAIKWIQKAAEQGHPVAQTNLGVFYLKGEGVELDKGKAYAWFLKAAQQDYARAQYYLGGLYYEGKGVDRNIIEAIRWLKKAANQSYDEAQKVLQNALPVLSWKEEVGDFKGFLLMGDKSGKTYPNEEHISSQIEKANYLTLKAGDEFTAVIGASGCNKDSNGKCTETADIWLFGPDWSLIKELKDASFYYKSELGFKNNDLNTAYIFMNLTIDLDDPLGQYRIITRINENGKPKMELNQIFWVQN